MAGRPRTMLKRLWDWYERSEQLCNEVLDGIPEQYRNHDLNQDKYRDDERAARLRALWQRDPLTARWIEVHDHALSLPFELIGLASEIEWRAARKGLRLHETRPVTKPDDNGLNEQEATETGNPTGS